MVRKIAITGAGGILGYHLRVAAKVAGVETVGIPLGRKFDREHARRAVIGADKIIHLAGVNTGDDQEVTEGNLMLADQVVSILEDAVVPPKELVYSNSIHADYDTVYGSSKRRVSELLHDVSDSLGIHFLDVKLPNLFGEFARPFRNGVVATFSHLIAEGKRPEVLEDKELQLLHLQNAADVLLGSVGSAKIAEISHWETVTGVKQLLQCFARDYSRGTFPSIASIFHRDLFSTYLSHLSPRAVPAKPKMRRKSPFTGIYSEFVTEPRSTRGSYYHRRKLKQVTVLAGQAEVHLKKVLDSEGLRLVIPGDAPYRIDVPALCAYEITNIGAEDLHISVCADGFNEKYAEEASFQRT